MVEMIILVSSMHCSSGVFCLWWANALTATVAKVFRPTLGCLAVIVGGLIK